ncbi:echinoderm microtubule-associated protein-like 3 isoform X2 [Amblyraja radiata]|uniref:echinoderm microtubule-associated protein-like 3 isoform X2 n=1 Tax=Amblyraja radiata TaxID=386614 RepID=UPI00140413E6|nr:echinoderm microtubule-associated protein-like 3 isoform X2 [Amblyraja radiata]
MDGASAQSLDDGVCVAGEGDEQDARLAALELRAQRQDDEIALLKAGLAGTLRRIEIYDQHFARLLPTLAGNPLLPDPLCPADLLTGRSLQTLLPAEQTPARPGHVSACSCSRPLVGPGPPTPSPGPPALPGPPDRTPGPPAMHGPPARSPGPLDPELLPQPPVPQPDPSGGGVEDRVPAQAGDGPEPGGLELGAGGRDDGPEPEAKVPVAEAVGPEPRALSGASPGPGSPLPGEAGTPPPPELEPEPEHDLDPAPLTAGGRKKVLLRRCSTSDKLRGLKDTVPDTQRPKLTKKSVSTQSLLSKGRNADSRNKELPQSPVASTSRRGFYNQEGVSIKVFLRGRPITMYVPLNVHNYEELRTELPAERLKLDWVYGYRGKDSRGNLHLLLSGEVVYFIACVVVLHGIETQTQRHYVRHTDCVRCLAIHPDGVRIASGQAAGVDKDGKPLLPSVHVWDSGTLQTLQHIGSGSFERGVGCLAFSRADAGSFLCVIDDSNEHVMSVWDTVRGCRLAETKTTNESVLEVGFHPADTGCIVSCGKSHVYFWSWNGSSLTKKQGIFGKYKKPRFIQCFVFLPSGEVLTGDSEGNILVWGKAAADTKTLGKGAKETYQIARQVKAHEGSIFTLCVRGDGALLSGGGKDRKVILWGPDLTVQQETEISERAGAVRTLVQGAGDELLIGTTRNSILRGSFSTPCTPIVQGHTDELWGLTTHPCRDLFLTCAHDRRVCVWDLEHHSLAWSRTLEATGLCADFHCSGTVVVVGLQTGRWVVLDCATQEDVCSTVDGNEQLSVVRFSPDGNFLAVGSHDNYIYLHTVTDSGRRYSRYGRCMGHSSFITHLDWSQDSCFIMSNSGDYEILYWDIVAGGKLIRNRYECKDLEWISYTCVLGFHVFGVWPDGSDGTDINALCRSHNERVVAVADDFCKVHLFQYPCSKPKAPSHMYGAHGSHVTNVRFTHDDSYLISTGGKDTTVMQWRVTSGRLEHSTSVSSASASSLDLLPGST